MRKITRRQEAELRRLAAELAETRDRAKELADRERAIRERILEIVDGRELPIVSGRSQYLNVPEIGRALRVTRQDPRIEIDPERLREEVGDEVFHLVCRVRKVDFDASRWQMLLDEERVTDSMLQRSIVAQEEGVMSVTLGPIQK